VSIQPLNTAPRSFKHRRGRITSGQQDALDTLWPRYGLDVSSSPLDLVRVFGRTAPVILEIGFGMGETTMAMAAADPARDVIAVDVHTPGAGALLRDLDSIGRRNVRVIVGDALDVLREMLLPQSIDEIRVYFPDPWPKVKHHKRRLFTPAFAALTATRLRPGGLLHSATDWAPYAERMLRIVGGEPLLVNTHRGYAPRPPWRPITRFEQQGLSKGHQIFDVVAERCVQASP
jgi:tRNA (guanine-N7-)-methyltransferase